MAEWLSVIIGLTGLASLVFAAFKFRREDTAAIVNTQSTVVHDIQTLNAELRLALEECEQRGRAG